MKEMYEEASTEVVKTNSVSAPKKGSYTGKRMAEPTMNTVKSRSVSAPNKRSIGDKGMLTYSPNTNKSRFSKS